MDLGVGCGVSVDVFAEFENTRGLSQRYNEFIDYCKGNYSYLALVHDDVWLNDVLLFQKLMDSEFDVIGLCGGRQWIPNPNPEVKNIWTRACAGMASGFVVHSPNPCSFFASSFGLSPQ